ncbi:MAG TPA: hypothetical protein PLE75_05050 [Ferruginibacter sp.]|nr:hypothetical protein [Ferruginibacter sp.]HRO06033.1 hypothetical protein [Ferruginibacter sp.]HRO97053.1 hypothetical protein [Ferruginibacter sp.]HRP49916.1 hypothetical protein [Ferruginibacter sp.]
MKKLTIIILTFTFALTALGQTFEPQILILTPNEFKYDKTFDKDIKSKNKELLKRPQNSEQADFVKSDEFKKQPDNIQKITLSEINFSEKLDFSKQASFIAHQYLAYRFYERFPNLLILLSNIKSDGSPTDLKKIADNDKIQYVLNFPRIEFFKRDGISFAKISVQLYDNSSQTFLINSEYEGDWTNPGFEFACEDKSINCTVNNALSKALGEVIYQVVSNSPTIKRDKELAQKRFDELIKNHFSKPNDKDFLSNVVPTSDSNIVLADQYQILLDQSKTKFVAFFITQVSAQDFKALKDNKKDKNINIISSKDIKDEGFLDDVPQTYAYIVNGVKYNNKWYYEKSSVTYFEAKNIEEGKQKYFYNLAKWNFFKENSAEFNPDFWESYFFTKVESAVIKNKSKIEEIKSLLAKAKTAEDKEIYQNMIDDYDEKDIKNEGYFGLYEIVANQLRQEKRKQDEQFSEFIKTDFLPKFYENYCRENKLNGYVKMNGKDIPLIFPSDKSIILSPIVLDKGNEIKDLHFFVLIPNEKKSYSVYKWNYFDPIKPQYGSMYGQEVNKQLNQITKWNFSFDTLDDTEFWRQYVLVKMGDNYKNLTKIQ